MSELNFKSAGVSTRTIDLTGPTALSPQGIPAGVIGTSAKGPAFVPTTVATSQDFFVNFGNPEDGAANGPLAVSEWLRNQQSATFIRVLGVGQGKKRETSGDNQGRVLGAGYVVGDEQPQASLAGALGANAYANSGGEAGRLYFLGAFMSESNGSTMLSEAGQAGSGAPVIRGVLMAASGVLLRLSSSIGVTDNTPVGSDVAGVDYSGAVTGSVGLSDGRQEFVMLLNGHKGTNSFFPVTVTASFDVTAANYFTNVMNTDPLRIEEAGYVVYADYPVHPTQAVITGSDALLDTIAFNAVEPVAFLLSGSAPRNTGTVTAPSFENFEDRFQAAKTPWITSQKFGGKPQNLFRLHAIDDGKWPNVRVKFSIENITPGTDVRPHGTFDLLVRDIVDTDKNRAVIESFRGLSLDPSSARYIGKFVGDTNTFYNFDGNEGRQKLITEGNYPRRSTYIRVEMSAVVEAGEMDASALPMGFRGVGHLVTQGTDPLVQPYDAATMVASTVFEKVTQIPVPYRENLNVGSTPNTTVDRGLYWGVQFTRKTNAVDTNTSTVPETAIASLATYFPDFGTNWVNVAVSDNEGTLDTTELGLIDADRFNNNLFSLENIKITYTPESAGSVNGTPNTLTMDQWNYVRQGSVSADASGGTRPLRSTDLGDSAVRTVAKFSFYMQGGYDGVRIFNEDTSTLSNQSIVEEMDNINRGVTNGPAVTAYKKALALIADATEVDIQLLAIPGIRHEIITDQALLTTEARFDAMYIMDISSYDGTNTLISSSVQIPSVRYTSNRFRDRGLNSSFGASYYPDLIFRDNFSGRIRTVPPSVAVLGAFGKNDSIGHPWFAPAGFTRGAMPKVEEAETLINRDNMDSLQDVDINPLVSFAGSKGTIVWGQKTLLASDSSLERVNVRRLLIEARRQVRTVANRIIFEQGRAETLARFEQLVRPIMKRIQDQNGLERYLVKIDMTTTSQADIENKTIRGKIFLVPTKTLEFLSIDIVLTNNGNFVTEG